ncbi:MAG: SGNH/GDSL hydrolase family protein [Anaerolineales bacterium]|nr:SGNH/GDSL hydrolase family protein [Anaerolineales bacterium]
MKLFWALPVMILLLASTACAQSHSSTPPMSTTPVPTATILASPSPSPSPTASQTPTNTSTPTPRPPRIFVFYGDSTLAIGKAGDGKRHGGYSFINNLKTMMPPDVTLITANYGGRSARWAALKIEEKVLVHNPDVVTLWWGINDLLGCPGIFDRETNRIRQDQVKRLVNEHITALKHQIDILLAHNLPVFVMTTLPVWNGYLPWSHLDENYNVIWESGRWCPFNQGLSQLVQAQRDLVATYQATQEAVYLVDIWELYMQHKDEDGLYMDVLHPGPYGVQLIAEEWLKVYLSTQRRSSHAPDSP